MSNPELDRLVTMHAYCRPAGSVTEDTFIARYLKPLGAVVDDYGNWSVVVGDCPSLVWSCHTDTVHNVGGSQRVRLSASGILSAPAVKLKRPIHHPGKSWPDPKGGKPYEIKPWVQTHETGSGCLGADDTAGVWLMAELIRRGVPGRYLFHYGEEEGCIGSRALADDHPAWIDDARFIIALDRKGTGDIITHQCHQRTASDAFAWSLAKQLNAAGLHYAPSELGLYTDSDSYAELVAECTNVSIGYSGNHSQAETLDTNHALRLLDALSALDVSGLVCSRDPRVARGGKWGWWRPSAVDARDVTSTPDAGDDDDTLPVIRQMFKAFYCSECGEEVTEYQQVCYACGADDPASEDVNELRAIFLDRQFAAAQAELQKSFNSPVAKLRLAKRRVH